MKALDTMNARGQVAPSFVDIRTGKRVPWGTRHNTLSYDASHAMALAFGDDRSLVPNRIGVIYGGVDIVFGTIGRDQSWSALVEELQTKKAEVQVQSFSYSPSFRKADVGQSSSGSAAGSDSPGSSGSFGGSEAPGWAVTFHMHSDSVTPGSAGTYDDSSSSVSIFTPGMYIYQAVLLNKTGDDFTVLARVSLDSNGTYYQKPRDFELALDWTVRFF